MHTAVPVAAIILDTVLKATVLLALASIAALVLKKRSAAMRYMVRAFVLAALLLLPFSVMLLPAWHVKGLPGFAVTKPPSARTNSPAPARVATSLPPGPALAPASAAQQMKSRATEVQRPRASESARAVGHPTTTVQPAPSVSRQVEPSTAFSAQSAIQIAPAVAPSTAISVPAHSLPAARPWLSYLAPLFLLGWTAGTLFFLGRWSLNTLRLSGLVRRASVLTDSGWNAQVRALSGELGIERHVALLVSDEIEVPITAGVLFPKIVL